MRQSTKRFVIPVLAAVTALAMCLPAYAEDTKIKEVKFRIKSEKPEAGDSIGTPDVEISNSAHCKITEGPEYDNSGDEWERGDKPVIVLTVEANEGYKFSSTKVSTTKSSYKAKKVHSDSSELEVEITLDAVSGDLDTVEDLYWSGRTAHWDEIFDADKYEVKLYRNGNSVTTVTTSSESYNFYPYMTKSGDYTFRVRGISNSDRERSDWSDESEEYYMNSSDVYTGTPPANNGSVSSSNSSSGWTQDQFGWTYRYSDGNLAKGWIYVDNNWFYMAQNGYMMTGWLFVDNNWFYLNPVSDGTRGAMKTGWQFIDNNWYYLNPISDGTRGARMYGYQFIDGNWYVLDPASGVRWSNVTTAFGQWIDANGVVH